MFCGNGAQYAGMGQDLFETDAAYRAAFIRVSKCFQKLSGLDLVKLMDDPDLEERLDHGLVGQPLLLALQIALVEALAARGLTPDAVAGHSMGEVAAAWTAGCLGLTDACRLIHARASAMEALRGEGGMAAVLAGASAAETALAEMGFDDIDLAGDNSPRSSTLSGPAERIAEFLKAARARRLAARPIPVSYPYHGPALERIREELITGLSGLRPKSGSIPVFSATTGALVEGKSLDAAYWWHNARDRVRFREALTGLAEFGAATFIEIAPRPQLQTYVTDTLKALGKKATVISTLDTGTKAGLDTAGMVARALAHGAEVDTKAFFGPERGPVDRLPGYVWSHAPYRIEQSGNGIDLLGRLPAHPLLGWQARPGEGVWRTDIDLGKRPWLADHVVDGAALMPGAGFVEIALAAGAQAYETDLIELRDFDILAPLSLEAQAASSTTLRTTLETETGILKIESRPALSRDDWVLHARGTVGAALPQGVDVPANPGLALLPEWPGARLYALLDGAGLSYGPSFRRVRRLRAGGGWAEADLEPVTDPASDPGLFQIHPALLDGSFHAIFPLIAAELADRGGPAALAAGETYVPVRFGQVLSLAPGTDPVRADLNLVGLTDHGAEVALTLRDGEGRGVVRLEGLRLQKIRLRSGRAQVHSLWCQQAIPALDPNAPAALGAEWREPAAQLVEIGLAAPEAPEPAAGALIVDAGFRRVAWEALARLADSDGRLAPRPEALAESALPLYHALRQSLEEDDVVVRVDEDAILLDCPYPRLEDLTDALISEAPERASDLMSIMSAVTVLDGRLAEGLSGAPLDPAPSHAPWQRDLADALAEAAQDVASSKRPSERFDVVLIGDAPAALVRKLLNQVRPTRLILTDPDAARVERMRAHLAPDPALSVLPWDAALEAGGADLVLSADGFGRVGRARLAVLGDFLRPGGLILAIERQPELGATLTQGLICDWWSATISPEAPVGRLGSGSEWAHALTSGGFDQVEALVLDRQEVAAAILTARRPVGEAGQMSEHGSDAALARHLILCHEAGDGRLATDLTASGWQVDICATTNLEDRLAGASVDRPNLLIMPAQNGFAACLDLLHRLAAAAEAIGTLWLLVPGGAPAASGGVAEAAQIWGLARVAMNEFPALDTRLVDADPGSDGLRLAKILVDPGKEREWLLRDHAAPAVPRVEALSLPAPAMNTAEALSLGLGRPGALDTLEWQPTSRRAPGRDEIEIEIVATGLNFRDVMWAQRLLPAEALEDGFAGATLGMECAGKVIRAGASSGFEPGERVIAFAAKAFSSHATVPSLAATRLPEGISFATGASLPTIFLTAHYALLELARLAPGESVLIHGGAGGVGLAALQIARARGARVFATAGHPRKRRMLELLGAEAVFDSRSLSFVDAIRSATDEEGVDVVLNSLAGQAMARSLDLVRPFGRFIELGKLDYYGNTRLGLRPFRRNISYFGVDADQLVSARPELAERMFADLSAHFADGTYTAPPIQVFAPDEAVEAFRLMQKSDHIGKVVVQAPTVPMPSGASAERAVGEGAWLISGGLGGLGLAMAEWLAGQGVPALWLVSRSGKPLSDAADRIVALRHKCRVTIVAADITDAAAMAEVTSQIALAGEPLEGVIHAAMVLEDALIADLSEEQASRVLAPKVAGAELLDELTRPLAPAHFVMFSSVTTLFGNPGQAAYVAANTALEQMAHRRRAEGLPGLAIGWGPIADQGYLAREADMRSQLERQLKGSLLQTAEVLEAFGRLIRHPETPPAVSYAPMRWGNLAGDLPLVSGPLFERVDRTLQAGPASAQDFLDEIAGLEDGPARERITAALVAETARILRQPEGEIDPYRPMTDLGFDSLMAVDLKLSAEEQLGIALPLTSLSDQMTLADLAIKVLTRIRSGHTAPEEDGVDTVVAKHVGIAGLDEDVVEEVLSGVNRTTTGHGPGG
ncbi:MAG: SDR family NAD(P)-dependent oxidoreductase [Pseudomonadota bacterium]